MVSAASVPGSGGLRVVFVGWWKGWEWLGWLIDGEWLGSWAAGGPEHFRTIAMTAEM